MKKAGMILAVILLTSLMAGCIGGKTEVSHSPAGEISSGTPSVSSTASSKFQQYPREELLKNIKRIHQFSFLENTSVELNIVAERGNFTQNSNATAIYHRRGYIDLEGKRADINTTTITFPGGTSVFTRTIIVGGDFYVFFGGRWIKLTNNSHAFLNNILNMTWKYNIINLTGRYLLGKPFREAFKNGTQLLYYNITNEDLRTIAEAFLRGDANPTFNVTNGVLELRFRNGVLIGGRMGYHMNVHIQGEYFGEQVNVYEAGNVYDEFVVFDINIKKRVNPPELERA
ncbi:hypothetical protein [Thermococcus sp.]|uniref:hypothetical protein n=1 Tax=Thermococcus sp. TaxID=35749 RepID=UPI00261F21E2|nr:hypothetical protein [Thermococcus sp.]